MTTIKKNYKSDFDAILHLKSCVGDVCQDVGWPDYDWVARFYTTSYEKAFIASNIGGVLTNCFNDDGNIHVVFNNHGLESGTLRVEFSAEMPNSIYPDGSQLEVSPQSLHIELVRGVGDCGTIADVEVMLSFIKGDKGDPFTYADFTPEQISELQKPATEAAESVAALEKSVEGAESLRVSAEQTRVLNEEARVSAENTRISNENARKTDEGLRQGDEAVRQSNEQKRATAEETRVQAEAARAEEFATWQSEIDSKQDALTTTEDLSISTDNELSLTDMAKKRLFIDMWNEACYDGRKRFGCYNEDTGFFEYGPVKDLTYEDAILALSYCLRSPQECASHCQSVKGLRVLMSKVYWPYAATTSWRSFCHGATELEYILLTTNKSQGAWPGVWDSAFADCYKLHTIEPHIQVYSSNASSKPFRTCYALENVQLSELKYDFWFGESPKLSLASMQYLVNNASSSIPASKPITVTVHADVYAKLTGDTTNEAAAALTEEELAQWQQVLTDAAAKNINFACP